MEKIKLKPCPFCGTVPKTKICESDNEIKFVIYCRMCWSAEVTVGADKRDMTFENAVESVESAVKKCIVTWETRSGEK